MTAETNGNGTAQPAGPRQAAAFARILTNAFSSRQDWLRKATGLDPRRDLDDECGYPKALTPQEYQDLYDRDPIPARVVEVLPKESWQVTPWVYESEDASVVTPFEAAWDALGGQLRGEQSSYREEEGSPVWEYLLRADILSGIGQYGVILLGLNDGLPLDRPAAGIFEQGNAPAGGKDSQGNPLPAVKATSPYSFSVNAEQTAGRKLLFLRVFPESLATINRFEANPASPRFGQPLEYTLTLNDPGAQSQGAGQPASTKQVHWSRVIHVADVGHQAGPSEVFAAPRMRPVLPRMLDLRKVYGADGESYWRNCMLKLFFETHPEVGGDAVIDSSALRDDMEQMMNGLQQWMALNGMSAKSIAPAVADPTSHIAVQVEAICIKIGCPVRVFKGSERGELSSSQDDAAWNDRLKQRQTGYLTPRLVVPLVDRLITVGVLPRPVEGYCVEWPDLTSQTDADRAGVAVQKTTALAQYVGGGVEAVMPPLEFLTHILGMDDEEAAAILQAADQALEEKEAGAMLAPLAEEPEEGTDDGAEAEPEEAAAGPGAVAPVA